MAVVYPLTFPTTPEVSGIDIRGVSQTSISSSPFTFKQQAHVHSAQRWEAELILPQMDDADAGAWKGWLLSLNGRTGSFLMGDPKGATAQGTPTGTPVVNGAGQTGSSVTISGATPNTTGWLKTGDYVQFGAGSTATLHMVVQDANADASGVVTLDIWPSVRTSLIDASTVVVSNTVGRWRLNTNTPGWSYRSLAMSGMVVPCVEAIT